MAQTTGSPDLRERRRRRSWAVALAALAVPVGLVVTGGGSDTRTGDRRASTTTPAATPTTTAAAIAGTSTPPPTVGVLALTGLPGDVPDRPALAVKIDGTRLGRPQTGLLEADVVVEELVEGGLTRLMAVYHSQVPDRVGPVRSARSTDIQLLAEMGRPLFAWSGANPTFAAAVRAADVVDVGAAAAPGAYWRDGGRRAPYNLYTSPPGLWGAAQGAEPPPTDPPNLFAYRPVGVPLGAGSEPVGRIRTTGAAGLAADVGWAWDPDSASWLRTQDGAPHVDAGGNRVSAANVVVRMTSYRDSGVRDSTGAVVPEAVTVGEGEAWLLSDGRLRRGRWSKPGPDAVTIYTAPDGGPLLLTPGRTWLEVLPPGTFEVTGG